MSLSINHVTLAGNLSRDAEYRTSNSGNTVCNFGIAVSKRVKDQAGNWIDEADFFDCVLFGNLGASFQQNESLTKGTPVSLEGRLQLEKWQDKTTGENRTKVSVIANTVIPYSRNQQQQPQNNGYQPPPPQPQYQQQPQYNQNPVNQVVGMMGGQVMPQQGIAGQPQLNNNDIPF